MASRGGLIEVSWRGGTVRSASVVVPPEVEHRASADSGFVAVFVDAPALSTPDLPSRPAATGTGLARAWLEAADGFLDTGSPGPVWSSILELLGPRRHDPLAAALDPLHLLAPGGGPAGVVGVSPAGLRELLRDRRLPTLGRLRRWAQLTAAVDALVDHPPAWAAAAAGFSDQPHLTRACAATLGLTPGSIRAR